MFRNFFCTVLLFALFLMRANSQGKIFEDDFSNNEHGWKLQDNKEFLVEIKDGVLHLEKFEKNFTSRGCLWQHQVIPGLNTQKNFSITIYARYLRGGDIIDMIDFQWGERNKKGQRIIGDLYQLSLLLSRGEAKLDYFNERWTYFVRKDIKYIWEEGFRPREMNKYELVQKDSTVSFRINDREVLKQFCSPIPGNSIGFQNCLKCAWEIDKIVVRQEQSEANPVAKDTPQIHLPLPAEITRPTDNKVKVFPNPFQQHLQVNLQLEKEENVQVSLVDINGITLQQHNKQLPPGIQQIHLYADVPAGSYVLKLQIGKKLLTAIVIKQ